MKHTPNNNFRKPDGTDRVDVGDLNENMNINDDILGNLAHLQTTTKVNLVEAINEAFRTASNPAPFFNHETETFWEWNPATAQFVDTYQRATGDPAGFDTPIASATTVSPDAEAAASVTASGPDTKKIFDFKFKIPQGKKGERGEQGAGLKLLGIYPTLADLEYYHPTGATGDAWVVGTADDNTVFVWDTSTNQWENIGQINGPQGERGEPGEDGPKGAPGADLTQNHVINGNFDIWQRGTLQTVSGYGSDDRWTNQSAGTTFTHSQQPFIPGQTEVPGNPTYFSSTIVNSVIGSSNYSIKLQRIEGVSLFSGKTVTVSFWAKANDNTKKMVVEFVQNFGTGGSAEVAGIGVSKLDLSTDWQKYTVTTDVPSVTGKAIMGNNWFGVQFWFDAGSNWNYRIDSLGHQSGIFDIAQVKLEIGDVATPFVPRLYAEELALCQRYYVNVGFASAVAYGSASSWTYIVNLPITSQLRVRPTITILQVGIGGIHAIGTSQVPFTSISFAFSDYSYSIVYTGVAAAPSGINRLHIECYVDAEV